MKCGRKSGVVAHEGGRKRGVLLYDDCKPCLHNDMWINMVAKFAGNAGHGGLYFGRYPTWLARLCLHYFTLLYIGNASRKMARVKKLSK